MEKLYAPSDKYHQLWRFPSAGPGNKVFYLNAFLGNHTQTLIFIHFNKNTIAGKKYRTAMLFDDNEIDNLINYKMIEAASISENIYTHTGAKSAIEFLKNMEKLDVAE